MNEDILQMRMELINYAYISQMQDYMKKRDSQIMVINTFIEAL